MTADLKPCPWCGKMPAVSGVVKSQVYWVRCGFGAAHNVIGPIRKTEAGAIKAWNERRPR
jgi:hypothetical protein